MNEKMSQRLGGDEKGSKIDKNAIKDINMKNKQFVDFFQENMEKCRQRWKMMKNCQIMTKKFIMGG
jgi:hypothetical protein